MEARNIDFLGICNVLIVYYFYIMELIKKLDYGIVMQILHHHLKSQMGMIVIGVGEMDGFMRPLPELWK